MQLFWGDLLDVRFYVSHLIQSKKTDIILDVGCGAGVLLYISKADMKIGVELKRDSIQKAKALDPSIELIQGDIRYLPLRNNFFKTIISIHSVSSFSNVKDRHIVCDEIKRVLAHRDVEIIFTAANLRSKHYEKKFSFEERKSYLSYKELIEYFKNDFDIEVVGYNPFSRILLFPLRRILLKIPDNLMENLMIEKLIFRVMRSKRYLRDGMSFIMICKSKNILPQ